MRALASAVRPMALALGLFVLFALFAGAADGQAGGKQAGRPGPSAAGPEVTPKSRKPATALDISSQVDRSEITIGDRIRYEVKVVYPAEGRIELPSVLGNLGSFEVKDYEEGEPKPAGRLKIQTWSFSLSTFTVGKYMIPPQQVVYLPPGATLADLDSAGAGQGGGGAVPTVLFTQPIEIKVARTSAETVKDIADIAPLAEVKAETPWLILALGALGALALALWFLLRKRKGRRQLEKAKPALPPFEEAMERLAALQPTTFIRQNRARELGFILSEVLRRYVSRRFGVDALESTTTEFLKLVPNLPVTASQKAWIARFCESTDLVKFAGAPLLESEAEGLVAGLKGFLSQTRPVETGAAK